MKNKRLWIGLGVVIIAGIVGFVILNQGKDEESKEISSNTTEESNASSQQSNTTTNNNEATASNAVQINDFAFTPSSIKVKVGDTVIWTNKDSASHTVTAITASADAPDSPTLSSGQTYSFTFKKAGTYSYKCSFHSSMTGTVVVE